MSVPIPEWREQAACLGLVTRGLDFWCPDEELPRSERRRQQDRAKAICATCPVLLDCAAEALLQLPQAEEHTIRAGLLPRELRQVAAELGMPTRRQAAHGTNSRYVGGCHDGEDGKACAACLAAHAEYEHERRMWARQRQRAKEQADVA